MQNELKAMQEVTELFSDPRSFHNDFLEEFEQLKENLQSKYTKKMMRAITSCQSSAQKNPSPEIKLMHAMKPFIDKEAHTKIDSFIDMFQAMNTVYGMKKSLEATRQSISASSEEDIISAAAVPVESSVHEDGIYDIDKNCHVGIAGGGFDGMPVMFMMLALMSR